MPYSPFAYNGSYASPIVKSPYVQDFKFSGNPSPPGSEEMITETGIFMVTESGNRMITE